MCDFYNKVSMMEDVMVDNLPMVFNCGHTFTQSQLNQILQSSPINQAQCPECKTILPHGNQILENHNKVLQYLVYQNGSNDGSCTIHQEPFEFYCFECEQIVCKECIVDEIHQIHPKKTIKQLKNYLFQSFLNLFEIEGDINRSYAKYETESEDLVNSLTNELLSILEIKIKQKVNQIIGTPKTSKMNLLTQIKKIMPESLGIIDQYGSVKLDISLIQQNITNINNTLTGIQEQVEQIHLNHNQEEFEILKGKLLNGFDTLIGLNNYKYTGDQLVTPGFNDSTNSSPSLNKSMREQSFNRSMSCQNDSMNKSSLNGSLMMNQQIARGSARGNTSQKLNSTKGDISCNVDELYDEFHEIVHDPSNNENNGGRFQLAPQLYKSYSMRMPPSLKPNQNTISYANQNDTTISKLEHQINQLDSEQNLLDRLESQLKSTSAHKKRSNTFSITKSKVKSHSHFEHQSQEQQALENQLMDSRDTFYTSIKWSNKNSRTLAQGTKSGKAIITETHNPDESPQIIAILQSHVSRISCIEWSYDDASLFTGSLDCCVNIWDTQSWTLSYTIQNEPGQYITCLKSSPTHHAVAIGSSNGDISIWDYKNLKCLKTIHQAHSAEICQLAWSLNDNYLSSGSQDFQLKIWETKNWHCIEYFTKFQSNIIGLSWFSESKYLFTGEENGQCLIIDLEQGKYNSFHPKLGQLKVIQLSENGSNVAFGLMNENHIQLWDFKEMKPGKTIKGLDDKIIQIEWSCEKRYLSTLLSNGQIKRWAYTEFNESTEQQCAIF